MIAGGLLSACTSASSQPPAVVSLTPASVSATSSGSASAASATPAATATPTATPGASLRVSADIDLGSLSAHAQPVAAQAPDGTVFYADGQVVMVVSGDGSPQVAEHPGAKVLGLGASTSTLYVVTPQDLIAYSRSSGNQTGRWALTGTASPATPTTAGVAVGGNGVIWAWTDWATDFSGYEYATLLAVLPGMAKPFVVSTMAEPGSLTTDGTHAFFVADSAKSAASLMEATPAPGASPAVSLRPVGSAPTLALVGFSRSQVILFAQPDSLYTYSPGSAGLAMVHAHAGVPVLVAGTRSGLLFLTCAKQACSTLTQVDQASGTAGVSVGLPANCQILLGPNPAVVGVESGHLHLVRLR